MPSSSQPGLPRRDFLKFSAATAGAVAMASLASGRTQAAPGAGKGKRPPGLGPYDGAADRIAFPLGGIGAGMVCLEGAGAISHVSIRNRPEVANEPCFFAALAVAGVPGSARVLEGPVPSWKLFGPPASAIGAPGKTYGLPRFASATFTARFPFATVSLADESMPLAAEVTGWSPFVPGAEDDSSWPVAALEYRFVNRGRKPVEAVFSFNAANFLGPDSSGVGQGVRPVPGGFVLWGREDAGRPETEAALAATVADSGVKVNHAWFRGLGFDPLTMAWRDVADGACFERPPASGQPAPGASLFVPFRLGSGEARVIALQLAWYAGWSGLRSGDDPKPAPSGPAETYRPWYSGRFDGVDAVAADWRRRYGELRRASEAFSRCLFDTTLPAEVMEAVGSNLAILKSPTVLRQTDGRLWAWEGCHDDAGCCPGNCTHVWNYAQAVAHLFPRLERSMRETEFGPCQDERGHQVFRAALPIRPQAHISHAAADGQLGGIMKVHREWRIGGDTEWLRRLWPAVKQSLHYCIETWDPERRGWIEEPHHNTYDVEFWGPDGMCAGFYLGALRAAATMGEALGDDVALYRLLEKRGTERAGRDLFNGEYFIQKVEWRGLRARDPRAYSSEIATYSPEAEELLRKEGPKYQYGSGCLSDGVLGLWLARMCGLGRMLDQAKVTSHLEAVHRHNLRKDLSAHANPQRSSYACGKEGGLLLCTWPDGGELSLPFPYANEVWTGIEHQVASHLMLQGKVEKGLEIVRTCRSRYDGTVRNPFDEYECGHWYARALSSYGLLQGMSGARYDAVEKVLHLAPPTAGDFRCFLATATGYGTVGVRSGLPFFETKSGTVEIRKNRIYPSNMTKKFENATVGAGTQVEDGVTVGFRYHANSGPALIGENGILRQGTIIYGDVKIGNYFQSGHYTVIRAKVRMGDYCTVSNNSTIEGIVRFGDGVRVMSHVYIPSRTWFGDHVFVGPGVNFLNDRFPGRRDQPKTPRGATVEDDVMIGGGCTILPGVRIGARSFIAAGAVVAQDIPPRSFVIGVPGRIKPLPADLDRPANRSLTVQPFDLWHPGAAGWEGADWPEDWGVKFAGA